MTGPSPGRMTSSGEGRARRGWARVLFGETRSIGKSATMVKNRGLEQPVPAGQSSSERGGRLPDCPKASMERLSLVRLALLYTREHGQDSSELLYIPTRNKVFRSADLLAEAAQSALVAVFQLREDFARPRLKGGGLLPSSSRSRRGFSGPPPHGPPTAGGEVSEKPLHLVCREVRCGVHTKLPIEKASVIALRDSQVLRGNVDLCQQCPPTDSRRPWNRRTRSVHGFSFSVPLHPNCMFLFTPACMSCMCSLFLKTNALSLLD